MPTNKFIGVLTTFYTYDYANRLTQSDIRVGNSTTTTTYAYGPFGERVSQTAANVTTIYPNRFYSVASSTGTGAKYATTTEFIYVGSNLLATIDQKVVSGTATGTAVTRYIHPDNLGSTNVTSDSGMNLIQWFDYGPYGSVIASTNASSTTTTLGRQFIGQFEDLSGLSYLNARYYNGGQGQFISQDPVFLGIGVDGRTEQALRDPQQLNSNSYARNNPIVLKDPNGDFLPLIIAAIEIGVEAYGAYEAGRSIGDVLNSQYLFRNDYSNSERNDALFNLGVNTVTFGAARVVKPLTLLERSALAVGPDIAGFAGNFGNPNTNAQNQGTQIYNSFQQFTGTYPGLVPSMYQMFSTQINSASVQDRNKAVQTYNVATGASTGPGGGGGGSSPSPSSLWVTPSGAVVTFSGQLVSAPPPSPKK